MAAYRFKSLQVRESKGGLLQLFAIKTLRGSQQDQVVPELSV